MAVINGDVVRELAAVRSEESPVITCYLDVDGRRLVRHQDCEVELERVLRPLRGEGGVSPAVEADLQRIEEYVRSGFDRSRTRSLAFFVCGALDLWKVVALPVAVRSRAVVNSAPAVGQLEAIVEAYVRIGVLLADRQRARLFVFELGELTERSEFLDALPRADEHHGHGDLGDRGQHRLDAAAHQHLQRAAQAAFEMERAHSFDEFALGAPDSIHSELEACLHPYLRERLVGRVTVPPSAPVSEVREAVLELELEVERQREAERVERLRAALATSGKGVAGLDDTLAALADHRADLLLVSAGFSEGGWRCSGCTALAKVGRVCARCGEEMAPVDDVVEEAIEDALAHGVKVDICVDNADLDVLGRVGALLRF